MASVGSSLRLGSLGSAIVLLSVVAVAWAEPAPDQPAAVAEPATKPSEAGDQPAVNGLPVLKELLGRKDLRLSADAGSAAERFGYWMGASQWNADRKREGIDAAVYRDGDDVLVVVYSRNPKEPRRSVPCCFITQGLLVGLDPERPGGLLVHEGVQPQFVFRGNRETQSIDIRFSYTPKTADRPEVVFDAGSILAGSLPKVLEAGFDPASNRLTLRTEKVTMETRPVKAGQGPCAVDGLRVSRPGGSAWVTVMKSLPDPPLRGGRLTAQSVAALGRPVRTIDKPEQVRPLLGIPVADFNSDPRHRETAKLIWGLLRGNKGVEGSLKF